MSIYRWIGLLTQEEYNLRESQAGYGESWFHVNGNAPDLDFGSDRDTEPREKFLEIATQPLDDNYLKLIELLVNSSADDKGRTVRLIVESLGKDKHIFYWVE